MIHAKNIFLVLILLLAWSSCRKNIDDTILIEDTVDVPLYGAFTPDVQNVTGAITIQVLDDQSAPIHGAQIQLEGQQYLTDPSGQAYITRSDLNHLGTIIQVSKNGYFNTGRRCFPSEGHTTYVQVQMTSKTFDQSFSSIQSAVIDLDHATLKFERNSIANADGTSYQGLVRIATSYLDPTEISTLDRMPGNLQGVNKKNEEIGLATYGMIMVELESEDGQPLNIMTGHMAQLEMHIPEALQINAPTEIPLWSFDENYGLWVEESVATLQDNNYVGLLPHFSTWNLDQPVVTIDLDLDLIDADAPQALPNTRMVFTNESGAISAFGFTDNTGHGNFNVPMNQKLNMRALDLCNAAIHQETVGSFSSNRDLGQVRVASNQILALNGTLTDCDGHLIDNGLIVVDLIDYKLNLYLSENPYHFSIPTCGNLSQISMTGIDLNQGIRGSRQTYQIQDNRVTDADVSACGDQFVNSIELLIDGERYVFPETAVYVNEELNETFFIYETEDVKLAIEIYGTTTGTYHGSGRPDGNVLRQLWVKDVVDVSFPIAHGFSTFIVEQFGGPGGIISGSFSGGFENNNRPVEISGNFQLIR